VPPPRKAGPAGRQRLARPGVRTVVAAVRRSRPEDAARRSVGGRDNETIEEAVDALVAAEEAGFHSAWRANIFGLDALTVLALAAARTSRIELGTAVVPTYPRHPHSLAQQAATTNAALGGRLVLGIGRSHQVVIESMFGLEYSKPITHMREYVTVLKGLFDQGMASLDGKLYKVQAPR
jgi:5,10-methylenetetrahydromethanopterin reductase